MPKTSIAWTDRSINPIRAKDPATGKSGHACVKVSPGCKNCYASGLQKRFGMPEYQDQRLGVNTVLFLDRTKLQEVLGRQVPSKWFWCDMTDLFGAWVPDEWVDACFATMAATPQHVHQVLTKRPDRMRAYLRGLSQDFLRLERAARDLGHTLVFQKLPLVPWPIPNVWLGVSVEDQLRAEERIPILLSTPAAIRFISAEPLLGPVDLHAIDDPKGDPAWDASALAGVRECVFGPTVEREPISRLDWVIVGGESGPQARPCELKWIRFMVQQCLDEKVAVFVKQLGKVALDIARPKGGASPSEASRWMQEGWTRVISADGEVWTHHPKLTGKGDDPSEWPEDLRVQEFPG